MKRLALVFVALLFVALCSSCHMNEKCPAYADKSVQVEQNG